MSATDSRKAEQDQLLETLYDEAQHVSLTVNDLLEMTRLHAGRVVLDRQWYPAEELIGAALERCKRQLAQHRVQTRLHPQSPMLHVDAVLMEKLLVNLIENAAKYTPAGTLITVVVGLEPGSVVIRVEDEGPGLPPGAQERVFDKFYRADREGPVTGSGLGLSICRAIAQMHGGTIAADNRHGGGAVFTGNSARSASTAGGSPMTAAAPLVLVVEDEPKMRRLLRVTLESNGMRYAEAATAREAISWAQTQRPDLIIADLGLPDGDGIDVIRQTRRTSATPIVVLSARSQESEKVAALDAGADDYVTKPFATGELLARLRAALRRALPRQDAGAPTVFAVRDLHVDLCTPTRNAARRRNASHTDRISIADHADRQGRASRYARRAAAGSVGTREARPAALPAHLHGRAAAQARSGPGATRLPAHRNGRRLPADRRVASARLTASPLYWTVRPV